MIVVLGMVVGFILGAVVLDWSGGLAGAFVGFIVMMAWRSRTQAAARQAARQDAPAAATTRVVTPESLPVDVRLAALEARLAALEARIATVRDAPARPDAPAVATEAVPIPAAPGVDDTGDDRRAAPRPASAARPATATPVSPPLPADDTAVATPAGFVRTPQGTLEPVPTSDAPPPRATAAGDPAGRRAPVRPVNALWAWFTGGNALTRVGVIALFVGVGFLLKYLADAITVPIGVRLFGVAAAGVILVVLGTRLMRTRHGYGVSLVGAGVGVLYLTTFAALRLYGVLDTAPAFALLVAISGLAVVLAARADSQPLAGLAVAGGFLAPFLVATRSGSPSLLLGYFLVLNAAILALALRKSWRALNAVGFVFTFVLGAFWGARFYRPEQFATVEPFLVALFLLYVGVAILHARQAPLAAKRPVDGLLVFGVPLITFALQAGLVRDMRYGVAVSGFVLAAFYAACARILRGRTPPGWALLSRAFAALAVVFFTVAIPFAVDPEWTPAWWALEAAAVYWIGCQQREPVARGFAVVLQVAAGVVFAVFHPDGHGPLFANAAFLGTIVVALAAFTTARLIDRHADAVSGLERSLAPFALAWGIGAWLVAGAFELTRTLPRSSEAQAMLAYTLVSVLLALGLARMLRWPRLAWASVALLPMLVVVAIVDWERSHTTLARYGIVLWPLVWIVQWVALRALERGDAGPADGAPNRAWIARLHAASSVVLVAWLGWEASEWVGRVAPAGSVWMPCAAVWPALVYLAAMARRPFAAAWPLAAFRDAYALHAGTVIATFAGVWFLLANVLSPGGAPPLPYLPLANPLDVTLVAVAFALVAWATRSRTCTPRTAYIWLGIGLFLLVSAIVFRSVHQWLGVPWRLAALVGSKPLQAALTLTWTAIALPLMVFAHRRAVRPLWMAGAALLAIVVVKLFVLDLAALSGLPRIAAFIGVGVLLLLIGYLAPLPPAPGGAASRRVDATGALDAGTDSESTQDRFQQAPAREAALQEVDADEGGERQPPRAHE